MCILQWSTTLPFCWMSIWFVRTTSGRTPSPVLVPRVTSTHVPAPASVRSQTPGPTSVSVLSTYSSFNGPTCSIPQNSKHKINYHKAITLCVYIGCTKTNPLNQHSEPNHWSNHINNPLNQPTLNKNRWLFLITNPK